MRPRQQAEADDDALDLDSYQDSEDLFDDATQIDTFEYLDYESSHEIAQDDIPNDESDVDLPDLQDKLHAPAYALFCQGRHPSTGPPQPGHPRARRPRQSHAGLGCGRAYPHVHPTPPLSDRRAGHHKLAPWASPRGPRHPGWRSQHGNERLAHPEPGLFFPTDQLLLPLIRFFGHSLKRFRNKEAGCRILAADYGLTESALKHIAMAYGQLPANREAAPTWPSLPLIDRRCPSAQPL